jgi:hypothetical protein
VSFLLYNYIKKARSILNDLDKKQIESYLSMNIDDLKIELARENSEIYMPPMGGGGGDEKAALIYYNSLLINQTNEWFDSNLGFFYGLLCIKANICSKISTKGFKEKADIALLIADSILAYYTKITAFMIAALIIQSGINKFCGCISKIDDEWDYAVYKSASVDYRETLLTIDWLMQTNPQEEAHKFIKLGNKIKRKQILDLVINKLKTPQFENRVDEYIESLPKG